MSVGRNTEEKGSPYQAQAARILYVDACNPEGTRNDHQDCIGNHVGSHYWQHIRYPEVIESSKYSMGKLLNISVRLERERP